MPLVKIAEVPDHEGADEWVCDIFDENGSHADPLIEINGSFATCCAAASAFVAQRPKVQFRVCIMRVM